MATQARVESGANFNSGVSAPAAESPFAQWLKTSQAANLDEHGRKHPSDLSALKEKTLTLRGAVPLSGPIRTEISVVKPAKEGEIPSVTTEPRIARVEVRTVGDGLAKDVQLVLALRKPEDDYKAEPTQNFDPLTAAQESLRASRVEIVPLESGDLSSVDSILRPGVSTRINSQVKTIERQARAYLAWGM